MNSMITIPKININAMLIETGIEGKTVDERRTRRRRWKFAHKSAGFEFLDRRNRYVEDRRQTQRVGHGSLPFEICIEYVVTGERVHSEVHWRRGAGINRASGGNYARGWLAIDDFASNLWLVWWGTLGLSKICRSIWLSRCLANITATL